MSAARVEVEPFRSADAPAAAGVLARAFLDDPVWTGIGPRRRPHRRVANRASFAGIVWGSHRNGARMRVARRDGRVVGATICFEPGRWPIRDLAALWEIGWVVLAGPLPVFRGLRDDRAIRARHVTHPHVYLWFIGVEPELHGGGVGRALMAEVHEASSQLGVPTYLETGTESNVGFYGALGYELRGELDLPSGSPMWLMERPAAGRPAQPGTDTAAP